MSIRAIRRSTWTWAFLLGTSLAAAPLAAQAPLGKAPAQPIRAVAAAVANENEKPAAASPRKADEDAIRAASAEFAKAFGAGDAAKVASFWTEEGEYEDEKRSPIRGREALAKGYAEFFKNREALTAESTTESIRFLGKDAAVEEGAFTVRPKDGPAAVSRYSALYVRQDGKWLMATLKEWDAEEDNRASVEDLAWLVGTWEGQGPEVKATTSYAWDEGKNFLNVKYNVASIKDGKVISSGLQVIGVDPASGEIHGWTFDSAGGVGESTWTWDGSRWHIESHGTLADGSTSSALNLLAPAGKDAFTWRSVQRTQNGESLPDLAPVKVQRVASKQ